MANSWISPLSQEGKVSECVGVLQKQSQPLCDHQNWVDTEDDAYNRYLKIIHEAFTQNC